jgi:hypothetical protein
MGYTTEFRGEVEITPALTTEQVKYVNAFCETRRMKRDDMLAASLEDARRVAVGLPVGKDGGYFVGSADDGNFGQGALLGRGADDGSIVDYNTPPTGQPGLWCQWEVSEDGDRLYWDGGEKFYNYTEWLAYLVEHFFKPWGRTLNGKIEWRGEDWEDTGTILVENNNVRTVAER